MHLHLKHRGQRCPLLKNHPITSTNVSSQKLQVLTSESRHKRKRVLKAGFRESSPEPLTLWVGFLYSSLSSWPNGPFLVPDIPWQILEPVKNDFCSLAVCCVKCSWGNCGWQRDPVRKRKAISCPCASIADNLIDRDRTGEPVYAQSGKQELGRATGSLNHCCSVETGYRTKGMILYLISLIVKNIIHSSEIVCLVKSPLQGRFKPRKSETDRECDR